MSIPANQQSQTSVITAAQEKLAAQSSSKGETSSAQTKGKKYQFPSAPTNFVFPNGRRVLIPDGVYYTEEPSEIAELESCVAVGNIWHHADDLPKAPQMEVPDPIDTSKVN